MRLQTEACLWPKRAGISALEVANLCLWMHSGAIPYCWEKPGLLMGTECSWGGYLGLVILLSVLLLAVRGWCLLPCYLHFSLCQHHIFSRWKRYCNPGTGCVFFCVYVQINKWTSTIEWKISREMECFCSMLGLLKTEKAVYWLWFFPLGKAAFYLRVVMTVDVRITC